MKKEQSLFNSGKTIFTPEEWKRKRKEIEEKAKKYDEKHEISMEDEQLIQELENQKPNEQFSSK